MPVLRDKPRTDEELDHLERCAEFAKKDKKDRAYARTIITAVILFGNAALFGFDLPVLVMAGIGTMITAAFELT